MYMVDTAIIYQLCRNKAAMCIAQPPTSVAVNNRGSTRLGISEFLGFQWQTFGRNSECFAESFADVAIMRLFVANVVTTRFFVTNVAITRFLGCNFTQNFGRKVAKI